MNEITKPVGRPTKYAPEVFNKIEEYLQMCGKEQMSLPTIEGLSLHLGVNTDTINEWAKKYPDFSATIKKLVMKQKQQLMDDGMYGGKEVNQAMAIFLLKVNHGMHEQPTSLTQVNIGGEMTLEFIGDESKTE
jgi:hypothetical protein